MLHLQCSQSQTKIAKYLIAERANILSISPVSYLIIIARQQQEFCDLNIVTGRIITLEARVKRQPDRASQAFYPNIRKLIVTDSKAMLATAG